MSIHQEVFSQSKTDHYIFRKYATIDSSAPPLLYTLLFSM